MKRTLFVMFVLVLICGVALGQSNEATITQLGPTHDGTITQTGEGNDATILQQHWYGNVGHIGTITQIGNDNFADQWQRGANRDRASIYQEGNDNHAEQDSRGASGTSNPARTHITQLGNDNYAYNYQHSSTWIHAYILQDGDNNWVGLSQNQADHAEIDQYGDNNQVASVSKSSDLTFVEGENAYQHTSSIYIQQGTELDPGYGNKVGFYQRGGAWADIKQFGDNNTALLWQYGDHDSWITQNGNQNQAEIQQYDTP